MKKDQPPTHNKAPRRQASEAYLEKLRDPRWQKMRLAVMNRDNWTCQFCGETKLTLNVHHLAYERGREPWEYHLSALLTLCEACHEAETPEHRRQCERALITCLKHSRFGARHLDALGLLFAEMQTDLTSDALIEAFQTLLQYKNPLQNELVTRTRLQREEWQRMWDEHVAARKKELDNT